MLRILIATLMCWGLALFLGSVARAGWRTGKIRHSDSSSFVARAKQPMAFWSLIVLFLAFVAVSLAVWVKIVLGASG